MSTEAGNIMTIDESSYPYIFEQNVSVPLQNGGIVRCNVYLPRDTKEGKKYPILATYGPYGKDIPYQEYINFRAASLTDIIPR